MPAEDAELLIDDGWTKIAEWTKDAGREKLREFVRIVFERQPTARQRYREGFFTDGHKLMWEYSRSRPGGEQIDFVEVMEIEDGLIRRHRVYWG